jgi:hypothetical protein
MYGYYFAHFMLEHKTNGFVLTEAQYAAILTGIDAADTLLEKLGIEFRREHARGGRLRPDIISFHVTPKTFGYEITVHLLEVTTEGQMNKTFQEDVLYKLNKLKEIVHLWEPKIAQAFSAPPRFIFNIGPSKWKPHNLWERIVPLPPRTDEKGQIYVEWICFQPTFKANNGRGIDGLLLYHIHSIPIEIAETQFKELVERIRQNERRQRQQQQVAYGLTLTPWLTPQYLAQNLLDRDQMQALAVVTGVGMLALLAYVALPVVAGLELVPLMSLAGGVARVAGRRVLVPATAMLTFARLMQGTMQTATQWVNTVGLRIVQP